MPLLTINSLHGQQWHQPKCSIEHNLITLVHGGVDVMFTIKLLQYLSSSMNHNRAFQSSKTCAVSTIIDKLCLFIFLWKTKENILMPLILWRHWFIFSSIDVDKMNDVINSSSRSKTCLYSTYSISIVRSRERERRELYSCRRRDTFNNIHSTSKNH